MIDKTQGAVQHPCFNPTTTPPPKNITKNQRQEVTNTIELTQSQIAMRIYGGHVFMAGGTLNFVNCMFWDFELLIPLIDRMRIGGDVLVRCVCLLEFGCFGSGHTHILLSPTRPTNEKNNQSPSFFPLTTCCFKILAGTATFTGCLWSCTTLVGVDGGLGLDVAIFGGTAVCHVQIINGVCVTAVAGQNFFVAGACVGLLGRGLLAGGRTEA